MMLAMRFCVHVTKVGNDFFVDIDSYVKTTPSPTIAEWHSLSKVSSANFLKLPMWLIVSGTYTLDESGRVVGSLRCCHEK